MPMLVIAGDRIDNGVKIITIENIDSRGDVYKAYWWKRLQQGYGFGRNWVLDVF